MTTTAPPRLAVAGCGYWGKNLVRSVHALGALAACCDANPALAGSMAEQYGVPAMDWAAVIADPDIAGVVIAAPAALHASMAKEALNAGKHVFVEKPLALDPADAAELCTVARGARRTLMVGHLLQYHPAFLKLKAMAGAGELGRIQYVYSNRLNFGKVRQEENILWSFAPHDISMILGLMGAEPTDITTVGANYLHKDIADVTTTHLSFAGGQEAHVFVSWLHPFKEQKLVVIADHAMAVFDDSQPWERKLVLYPQQVSWKDGRPEAKAVDAKPVPLESAEPLKMECQHFIDCILSGETPRTDGEEGLRVLRVLHASQKSMELRRPVKLSETKSGAKTTGAVIHESAYVDDGAEVGAGTRIWHFSHVLPRTKIGKNCSLGQNVVAGPDVTIGDRCKIQNNVSIYKGVTLGDGVFCGPSMVFTNVMNPRAEIERKDEFRNTLVKRGASIGANATVVCGTTLGSYCFIAAGAVVTKDVPDFAMMAGVPARRIGWMSRSGDKLDASLTCPRTGERYRVNTQGNLELTDDRQSR